MPNNFLERDQIVADEFAERAIEINTSISLICPLERVVKNTIFFLERRDQISVTIRLCVKTKIVS